jgi:hypothetical protein
LKSYQIDVDLEKAKIEKKLLGGAI